MSKETTSLEISLIKAEKINAYITLIAVILGIIALNMSERQLLEKDSFGEGSNSNNSGASAQRETTASNQESASSTTQQQRLIPTLLSSLAGWLLVLSNIIGVNVASTRFKEVIDMAEANEPDAPDPGPVWLLTIGVYIGFVSSILSALGAQQKVEEEQETVVITPL